MSKGNQISFNEYRMTTGEHGGPRPGAGRPAGDGSEVPHRKRPDFNEAEPAHVTIRIRRGIPTLRRKKFIREFRRSLRKVREREDFRVVAYSVQNDHVHLIVEASDKEALACGMKAIGSRLAKAFHRVFHRTGRVLAGRYHVRALGSPKAVRNALAYVLLNVRKHWKQRTGHAPPVQIDAASSGRLFNGWSRKVPSESLIPGLQEVSPAETWLLRIGWKKFGLIDPAEVPGGRKRRTA